MVAEIKTSDTYTYFAKVWGVERRVAKLRVQKILFGVEEGIRDPDRDAVMRHICEINRAHNWVGR